jgi:integral membrane protein (TIGR01906 family)
MWYAGKQVSDMEHTSNPPLSLKFSLAGLAHGLVVIALPLLLLLFNSRLVMTPAFLYFEYTRPGFPEDIYGLTTEERLEYAPYALDYLLNSADIRYLGDLRFSDGNPLFNARELTHMRDVKTLTQIMYGAALIVALVLVGIAYSLRGSDKFRLALQRGALLTLGLIVAIVLAAVINWDFFFTGFHRLFFEGGTWYFAYSDTLIRLFPEQFWFDAALLIGGLTVAEALAIIGFNALARRQSGRQST